MMALNRLLRPAFVFLVALCLYPGTSWAQTGTIAGTVKDPSGAVMPGVTVEAASPVLIEKVRVSVTDARGEYKLVDLVPGLYSVTFSLPGFNTLKRDGIELTSGVTVNVAGELRVGMVEETVTVSGNVPLVDVQNATQHRALTRDLIEGLPTGRSLADYSVLIPGVSAGAVSGGPTTVGQDVGGSGGDANTGLSIHGSNVSDMPFIMEGMRYGTVFGTGGYLAGAESINNGMIQEVSVDTSGAGADADVSGVRANIILKQGGPKVSGYFFANYANDSLQSNNIDTVLASQGITQFKYTKLFDVNPSLGGPLTQKLWFYGSYRYFGDTVAPPGAYFASSPNSFLFTPDKTRTPLNDTWTKSADLRLTMQTSANSKLNLYGTYQNRDGASASGLSTTTAFEATTIHYVWSRWLQASWYWTVSNRLLVELGEHYLYNRYYYPGQDNIPAGQIAVVDTGLGITYRATPTVSGQISNNQNGKARVTYVTGSHNLKFGAQWQSGHAHPSSTGNAITYGFVNQVPRSLTYRNTPLITDANEKLNFGAYAQEQWTANRLTLNLGVRFDYLNAYLPAQTARSTPFVPVPPSINAISNVPNWKDIDPRIGASYDVFGTGKTALKWNLGRYLESQATGLVAGTSPNSPSVSPFSGPNSSGTRTWNDQNGNFIPDCDLSNFSANLECGPLNPQSFGQPGVNSADDPRAVTGWGTRGYNWEMMAGIQHEVVPGLSADASYNRRWYGNLRVLANQATAPTDYDPYCITTPVDPRLPGGGGRQICGLYDVSLAKFGQTQNLLTLASNYGKITQAYDGVDVAANARLPHQLTLQGGVSLGRTRLNDCDVVTGHPEISLVGFLVTATQNTIPRTAAFCDIEPPFIPQIKGSATYALPWWSVQTSLTFQSFRGPQVATGGLDGVTALWSVSNLLIAPSLGRNLSAGAAGTAQVYIMPAGTQYTDRLHQVDLRIAKNFKLQRASIQGQFDAYNLLNENTTLALNNTYGARWQIPTAILPGRFLKFGVQLAF